VKTLYFKYSLFVSVVALNFPPSEIDVDDVVYGKLLLVVEIGQKYGHRSIRGFQSHYSEFDGLDFLSLIGRKLTQVAVGWGNPDTVFGFAAVEEFRDCEKRRFPYTSKNEPPVEMSQNVADKLETRIASIEEQDAARWDKGQQLFGFFSLRGIYWDHSPCYGKTPEDIIHRGDKAQGKVPFPVVLETAFRIELVSEFWVGRERISGTVYGKDAHPMPEKLRFIGPSLICQADSMIEDISENLPPDFPPRFGNCAAVDRCCLRPQATSSGLPKELTRFHIDPLSFSTAGNGEDKGNDFSERELSCSGEVFRRVLVGWLDLLRNNLQEFLCPATDLACFFNA